MPMWVNFGRKLNRYASACRFFSFPFQSRDHVEVVLVLYSHGIISLFYYYSMILIHMKALFF